MQSGTLERKIHFYRANVGCDQGGRPCAFDPTPALQHIANLPFQREGRYLDDDENSLCCWVDRTQANQRFRFAKIRRAGLPLLEQNGQLTDLSIPEDAGLAETIHVMVFPDNIVGADFNFFGPRLGRLSAYLSKKAKDHCPEVSFEPLLRHDVASALAKLRDISLFHLKIRASYAATVAEADADLGSAFDAAQRAGEAEELEIILRPRRRSRGTLAEKLLAATRVLAGKADLQSEAFKFQVRGVDAETDKAATVDILNDQLIAHVQLLRQSTRGRALDKDSAYAGIRESYAALKQELLTAAGITQ